MRGLHGLSSCISSASVRKVAHRKVVSPHRAVDVAAGLVVHQHIVYLTISLVNHPFCTDAQVLERALPESADQLLELVMRHATAGPSARFAAMQLLMIAAKCVVSVGQGSCSGMPAACVQHIHIR